VHQKCRSVLAMHLVGYFARAPILLTAEDAKRGTNNISLVQNCLAVMRRHGCNQTPMECCHHH
jgi:hypothetical protein